ncbi:MAG: AAA family ATPase [Deltaproteobacteria bacterium]|nr:AAA family ATPase [Deltaproteobacteria bacterium]
MARGRSYKEIPVEELRWRLDPSTLPFETTEELEPTSDLIGQKRALEAFRFGVEMEKSGYNIFVTGMTGSEKNHAIERLLKQMIMKDRIPDDLCYVNNFGKIEAPQLIRLPAGTGGEFKSDSDALLEQLKVNVPMLFESEDYLNMKKDILEKYEEQGKKFFKEIGNKVKDEGFALVEMQIGPIKRPVVMPMIEDKPVHIDQIEAMVEAGNFPKEKFDKMKRKQAELTDQIDRVFLEMRDMDREVKKKLEEMDRYLFLKSVADPINALKAKYKIKTVTHFLDSMIEDMASNLDIFKQKQQYMPGIPIPQAVESDPFQPYQVNLFVDNSECKTPPIIIESYPTYRNLFGSIERIVDRTGVWRTDFSRIKAGSFIQANGGYLILNLMDAILEPGVWPSLKRALKTDRYELQSYDPFFLFTTTGLKPEPIEIDVKVIMVGDLRSYNILYHYDPDVPRIFKVRADFDPVMDRKDEAISQYSGFIRRKVEEEKLLPFHRTAVAAIVEHSVRLAGRKDKLSTHFHQITDLMLEADLLAKRENAETVRDAHVEAAIEARIYRSNMIEEKIQAMIDRGTLMIDTDGAVVGQVNGLSVYDLGDYAFGKPTRITATTSMGRAGIINIEREADLSGSTHNKGMLILGGYLREKYAQDKPLSVSASIAFEQSYSGVDGDSASSTEIYALLSSLAEVPIRQDLAVTGSVNQHGEIQPIGGVNWKVEGFFECCKAKGLTGKQGVLIPHRNTEDLQLKQDVIEAVKEKKFHLYPVETIDQGIEILTGMSAGNRDAKGAYPKGSINDLVNRKLESLAKGLAEFGKEAENKAAGKKRTARKKPEDKE